MVPVELARHFVRNHAGWRQRAGRYAVEGVAVTEQPDTVQPDSMQPDSMQPDTVQPDTVQPDTVQPDTVQPRAVPGTPAAGGPATGPAGAGMTADIGEQPAVFDRLLGQGIGPIERAAARIASARPRFVLFTARGTSDHAALYAAYLTEIRLGIPTGLASPSAITLYGARPDLSAALVVGVSQSGGSPDLVEVLTVARETGAVTLAVTNDPGSPLAEAAELTVPTWRPVTSGRWRPPRRTPRNCLPCSC